MKTRLIAENVCVSDTTVRPRKDKYLFDFDCVNEAVLNALVHNDWTITEPQISLFADRIEILSHGGLPRGMTKQDFFDGISRPRNTTLMRFFLNMGLVEHIGHGIPTIIKKYGNQVFDISDNYIRCVIPFDETVLKLRQKDVGKNVGANVGKNDKINSTERKILSLLITNGKYTAEQLATEIGVTTRTIERNLARLQKKGMLERVGSKKDGSWIVVG